MTINIKDPEVDLMVRKLADMTGDKMTEVVRKAVQALHDREMKRQKGVADKINAMIDELEEECAGQEKPSSNNDWMYDEHGLPK